MKLEIEKTDVNVIDAAGRGTAEGLAAGDERRRDADLVRRADRADQRHPRSVPVPGSAAGLSLQLIFGWVFAPIAWALGVPWQDAATIGNLLGTRMVLNEFIAFSQLGPLKDIARSEVVHDCDVRALRLRELRSIGIQIGGIGALVPERRHDLARLGLRAMLAGTLANFLKQYVIAAIGTVSYCSGSERRQFNG